MENLKKFNTQEEYQEWKDGDDYVYPNVCKVEDEIIYNGYPEPFWIEALEDVTVNLKSEDISVGSYSFDKKTWTKMPYSGIVVRTGQKLYIINSVMVYKKLVVSGKYNAGGSILSLDYELNYLKYHTFSNNISVGSIFRKSANQIVSAKELILPNATVGSFNDLFHGCEFLIDSPKLINVISSFDDCFNYTYEGCISLTKAPTIPKLKSGIYTSNGLKGMFKGCSNLSYIKALFTQSFSSGSGNSYNNTDNWVEGVSPTGTFIANAKRTDFTRGPHGIPEGWDLYLYDEDNDRYVVKFKVNGIPYEYYTDEPKDVTWDEFVASKQNTNGFKSVVESYTPCVKLGNDYILLNGVKASGNIVLNASYTIGQPTTTTEE